MTKIYTPILFVFVSSLCFSQTRIVQEYYENGKLSIEGSLINGKKHNTWKEYYDNGQLKLEEIWKDGKENGIWTEFYSNGKLLAKGFVKDDKPHGIEIFYHFNGRIWIKRIYKEGNLVKENCWDDKGIEETCSNKVMVNCINDNYMSKNNINPENYYENRRELKTILLKSDFDLVHEKFGISCLEILSEHLYCNICFNSNENSLTSYDGRKYNFKKNISSIEITNKCLNLISNMAMGSNEYSEFFNSLKRKK